MQYKFLFSTLFIFCISVNSVAQTILTGTVVDSNNHKELAFVNIGIRQKNIGTTSSTDGTFSITIPIGHEKESLTFSMVGYSDFEIPIQQIISADRKLFQLLPKSIALKPVAISANRLIEKKFGIKTEPNLIHITDGSTNQKDIFEIAQLIKLDTTPSKITSVNLLISQPRTDSGTFRINFYGFDGDRPTERVIETQILQKKEIKEGWLKFDLTNYDVYLKNKFIVAIEFIPTKEENKQIYYEVKIGGTSKSFVRSSSHGEWGVPPHHYRLFVTALVTDKDRNATDSNSEEMESIPDTTLFSQAVNDSFSIYIQLPKEYSKNQFERYPVIYLLDANAYFDVVADAMNKNKTKAILIGIGYKNVMLMDSLRNRDYLFPEASISDSLPLSGGANHFLKFFKSELLPYIHQEYRVEKDNQTIMGHSYGGYFVLYALQQATIRNDSTFRYYVAASPSLYYSNHFLLKQFQSIPNNRIATVSLFATYGKREDSEDGTTGTEGLDNFNSLVTLLSDKKFKNVKIRTQVYSTFGHMETAIPTFIQALKEID